MKAEDLIAILASHESTRVFRIGTIPASYTAGRPQVQFDGESSPSTKTYPYLSSYTPAAGDRVLIALVGNSGVVLGKIV